MILITTEIEKLKKPDIVRQVSRFAETVVCTKNDGSSIIMKNRNNDSAEEIQNQLKLSWINSFNGV